MHKTLQEFNNFDSGVYNLLQKITSLFVTAWSNSRLAKSEVKNWKSLQKVPFRLTSPTLELETLNGRSVFRRALYQDSSIPWSIVVASPNRELEAWKRKGEKWSNGYRGENLKFYSMESILGAEIKRVCATVSARRRIRGRLQFETSVPHLKVITGHRWPLERAMKSFATDLLCFAASSSAREVQ